MGKLINEHIVKQVQLKHPDIFNEVFDGARMWQEKVVDPDTKTWAGIDDSHGGMLYTRYTGENDEEYELADNQYSCDQTYTIESQMRLVAMHHCDDIQGIKDSVISCLIRMDWGSIGYLKPIIEIDSSSTDALAIWQDELPEEITPRKDINLFKIDFTLTYEFDPYCEPITCKRCE